MKRESKRTNNRSVSVDLTMERSDMAVDDLPSFASPWEVLDADIKRLVTGNTALINAGQALQKKRFPEIHGLQDVFYARTLTFQPLTHECVQIINCADQHCVCATTENCKPNVVKIHDSMRTGDLTMDAKESIATIMNSQNHCLYLQFPEVQQQTDCQTVACLLWRMLLTFVMA